jgi:hypothetical protein
VRRERSGRRIRIVGGGGGKSSSATRGKLAVTEIVYLRFICCAIGLFLTYMQCFETSDGVWIGMWNVIPL